MADIKQALKCSRCGYVLKKNGKCPRCGTAVHCGTTCTGNCLKCSLKSTRKITG